MKSHIKVLTIAVLFIIYGCTKDNNDKDNLQACVNLISESPNDILVSDERQNLAEDLFNTNGIDFSNLQIIKVEQDKYNYYHIRCIQFFNGLKLFWGDVIFHFDENGEFTSVNPNLIDNISLNNESNLDYDFLVDRFLNEIENDSLYNYKIDKIIENCLDLEFGYSDLNAGTSNQSTNIIKAWIITPHNEEYPRLFMSDTNPGIYYYENGLIN